MLQILPGSSRLTNSFVAELTSLAKDCDFRTALEDNLRDRLVCGVADPGMQRKLLSEQNLTFQKAFEIAQGHEYVAKNAQTLCNGSSSVHQLKSEVENPCYRCGRKGHQQNDCKFKTATCHHCGKVGHIKHVCHSLQRSSRSSHLPSRSPSNHPSYCPSNCPSNRIGSSSRLSHIKQLVDDPETNSPEYTLFTVTSTSRDPPSELRCFN